MYAASLFVAQLYRYRRVATPTERQQTKWVVFGVSVALIGFLTVLLMAYVVPTVAASGVIGTLFFSTIIYGFLALIPLSIGMAILRSGLWAIDTIINRALVYGSLTLTLVLAYFGSIIVAQQFVRGLTGSTSQLAVVASTLLIAALVQPLRQRIQHLIDQRFFRPKYNVQQTVAAFSIKIRDETNIDQLASELVQIVEATMQPAHASLWIVNTHQPKRHGTHV